MEPIKKGGTVTHAPGQAAKVVAVVFFLVGAASIGFGAHLTLERQEFLARAVRVPGKVERVVQVGDVYQPVVRFVDLQGRSLIFQSDLGTSPSFFSNGEVVTVVYDPVAISASARIATFMQLWFGPLLCFVFGGGFAGMPLLVLWGIARRKS